MIDPYQTGIRDGREMVLNEMQTSLQTEGMSAWEKRGYIRFIQSFRKGELMKFSIMKTTSDDEEARYLVAIETPDFFSFYCSEGDRQMMIKTLYLEKHPHPQRAVKGCPALGKKTCEECAGEVIKLRGRSERE